MPQLTLFSIAPAPLTIAERFEAFHEANPQVYSGLLELALGLRRLGCERYSTKGLYEVLRHRRAMVTTDDNFKLNNDYTARYARLLMDREPELDGFFETREQRQ